MKQIDKKESLVIGNSIVDFQKRKILCNGCWQNTTPNELKIIDILSKNRHRKLKEATLIKRINSRAKNLSLPISEIVNKLNVRFNENGGDTPYISVDNGSYQLIASIGSIKAA